MTNVFSRYENLNVPCVDGIFDPSKDFVLSCTEKHKQKIVKRDIVGYAYNMVIVEDDIEGNNKWNRQAIRDALLLDRNLDLKDKQKEGVLDMMMRVRGMSDFH